MLFYSTILTQSICIWGIATPHHHQHSPIPSSIHISIHPSIHPYVSNIVYPLKSRPSVLSGNPQLTPNGGYTKRVTPSLEMASRLDMSSASREMSLRFSSMREGVTDLARTEEERATIYIVRAIFSISSVETGDNIR